MNSSLKNLYCCLSRIISDSIQYLLDQTISLQKLYPPCLLQLPSITVSRNTCSAVQSAQGNWSPTTSPGTSMILISSSDHSAEPAGRISALFPQRLHHCRVVTDIVPGRQIRQHSGGWLSYFSKMRMERSGSRTR